MGKHDKGPRDIEAGSKEPYEPKHSGGQDGFEWAKLQDKTPTVEIPKQKGK